MERQGLFRKRYALHTEVLMALATILPVGQISPSIVTKVAVLRSLTDPGPYILIGTGLLIIWILVRRHKQ
jgi:hypothetical protein